MQINGEFFLNFFKYYQTDLMLFLQGICLIIAFLTIFTRNLTKTRKTAIIMMELCAALYLTSSRFYYLYRDFPNVHFWFFVRLAKCLDYFFSLAILSCFGFYLRDLFTHEAGLKRAPRRLIAADLILLLGAITLFVSQYTHLYYGWDEYNHYVHSRLFFVFYFFPVPALLLQTTCVIQHYGKLPRRIRIPLLLFIIVPLCMAVLQLIAKDVAPAVLSTAGIDILLYIFTIEDMNRRVEKAHRLEIEMMAQYQKELEETVDERTRELKKANEKVEYLLLNILPEKVARELADDPDKVISNRYPNVTVLFTDVVGFTKISSEMSAQDTVVMLNRMMTLFDNRAKREGIEKIKTIGDAYMAAVGLSDDPNNDGAEKMVRFAMGLLEDLDEFNKTSPVKLQIRIGINSGELVAGVIGKTKFIYDIWGDNVNIASRMESTGKAGKIHVSEATYNQVKDKFSFSEKVVTEIKGKGLMTCYYL
ncbi:MAG: adenylate/guanylate cyclase domain-containing protein [Lachnospiraceae bacterium]|nr:adenylate/guanylate cyclase domain-containing protein [Lachnospiraceae bacterium]